MATHARTRQNLHQEMSLLLEAERALRQSIYATLHNGTIRTDGVHQHRQEATFLPHQVGRLRRRDQYRGTLGESARQYQATRILSIAATEVAYPHEVPRESLATSKRCTAKQPQFFFFSFFFLQQGRFFCQRLSLQDYQTEGSHKL